jgi:hypothetical protein
MLPVILLPLLTLVHAPFDGFIFPLTEENPWSGQADAALTFLSGNNTSSTSSLNAQLEWKLNDTRWLGTSQYTGIRQENSEGLASTTSRLYHFGLAYNSLFGEENEWFFYSKSAARNDTPNGLELRADIGLGLGYRHAWNDLSWTSFEFGPSLIRENLVGAITEDTFNSRFALSSEIDLGNSWTWTAKGEYFSSTEDSNDQSFTGESGIRWAFHEGWFLQGTAALAWDGTPAVGFGNSDNRFMLTIGMTF